MTISRLRIHCRSGLFLSAVVALAACESSSASKPAGGGGAAAAGSHGGVAGTAAGGATTGGSTTGAGGSITSSGGASISGGTTTVAGATAAGGSSGGTTSSAAVTVAGLPSPAAVLEAMHRANDWFMGAHPDATADIVTNKTRPSNLWTRAAYYEGLMGLYNVEPDSTSRRATTTTP
jgi:hypothetical protein